MNIATDPENLLETNDGSAAGRSFWPLLLVITLAALLLGGLIGYLFGGARIPSAGSVDAGFARDMSIHHEQAVQMAALAYDRTEDEAIRSLAFDILTTQQGQIGIMSGWLDAWGLPWTSAGPRMEWMGMSVTGLMTGMATPEQMATLRAATGEEADVIFLELMIPHHRGALEMAEFAAENAGEEPVRLLSQGIVEAQSLEINYMQELLIAGGHDLTPDSPAGADEGHDH